MSQLPLPRRLITKQSPLLELLSAYEEQDDDGANKGDDQVDRHFYALAPNRQPEHIETSLVLPRLSIIRIASRHGCPLPMGFYSKGILPACFTQPVKMTDLRAHDYRRPSQSHL